MFTLLLPLAAAADLSLLGVRVWDGGAVGAPQDLWVHDGRIVALAEGLGPMPGGQVLDTHGAVVLPGLIDAHVHLSMDPGAAWRPADAAAHAAALRPHLAAYLACGVTTILDPAVLPEERLRIEATLAGGAPGPRYLALGAPLSPPKGYVAVVVPGMPEVRDAAEARAAVMSRAAEGAVGVKVTVEDGFVRPIWPLHSDEVLHAIRAAADEVGLPVYAHAMSPTEQALALDVLHADVMVHPLDRPDRGLAARLAAAGVYEMTTLAVADSFGLAHDPRPLDDPWLAARVPAAELATAKDRGVAHDFREALLHTMLPKAPTWLAHTAGPRLLAARTRRRTAAGVRALRDAGVRLVLGSDAGNWPLIPYLFHGPSTLREVTLLAEAGLTPAEVLAAATRTPAEMLGLGRELGRVAVGWRADLVVVAGDPTLDLTLLREPRWVVRDGVAHTPAEWLAAGVSPH